MADINIAIARGHRVDTIPPELAHIQDIRLIDGAQPPAALPGDIEGHLGDPVHLRTGVGHGVEPAFVTVSFNAPLGLSEVDPTGEFANHHQVNTVDHLTLEAAGIDQSRHDLHRPQVGEQIHAGPQTQQAGLRTLVTGQVVETGTADRCEQHRIGGFAGGQCAGGEGLTGSVNGTAADRLFLKDELEAVSRAHRLQQLPCHRGDLRADSVTGKQNNAVLSHDGQKRRDSR